MINYFVRNHVFAGGVHLQLPGGVTFNGQQLYDEADAELKGMEDEMINSYSLPVTDMVG